VKAAQKFYIVPKELHARKDIGATAKIVLVVIADRMGENNFAWPGVRLIAKDAGTTTDAVDRAIRQLEKSGDLIVERRGHGKVNHYRLGNRKTVREMRTVERGKAPAKQGQGASEAGTEVSAKQGPNSTKNSTQNATKAATRRNSQHRKPTVTWDEREARFGVPPELRSRWDRDYPRLDVEDELAKAANWYAVNPPKRNLARFLVNWLNRAAERQQPNRGPGAAKSDPPTPGTWNTGSDEPACTVPLDEVDSLTDTMRAKE